MFEGINETMNYVWDQFRQTDENVVVSEVITSKILNSTTIIAYEYSLMKHQRITFANKDTPARCEYSNFSSPTGSSSSLSSYRRRGR